VSNIPVDHFLEYTSACKHIFPSHIFSYRKIKKVFLLWVFSIVFPSKQYEQYFMIFWVRYIFFRHIFPNQSSINDHELHGLTFILKASFKQSISGKCNSGIANVIQGNIIRGNVTRGKMSSGRSVFGEMVYGEMVRWEIKILGVVRFPLHGKCCYFINEV
jgi:hypothetical protein